MSGRAYIGTSGYNYKHWVDVLYPKSLPQSRWLERYAAEFDTVEINNSFYRLPERSTFESWGSSTPDDFTFAVKASRFLTHMKKLKDPEEPLERMLSHTEALGSKHGPVLYQLPPGWKVNTDRLRHFLGLLPKTLRHVFEFRDNSWQIEPVFDLLREYNVGYCIMSAPDLPRNVVSTAEFAYIRMHNGGPETDGSYSDDALTWWADQVRAFLSAMDVYVYFNNDYKGYAVHNAKRLKELLGASQDKGTAGTDLTGKTRKEENGKGSG